jgi:hypothetical protein
MKILRKKDRALVHETAEKCNLEHHHFVKEDLRRKIEKKAYELYEGRGCITGRDLEDWLEAEQMIIKGKPCC